MDFGFKTRGGTAPELTRVGYGRSNGMGRSTREEMISGECEQREDADGVGLPKTPPTCRSQRRGRGVGRTPKPRAGWGKRQAEDKRSSDNTSNMSSMLRPASRQALSDLMDLNLALKYDKIWKDGFSESRQRKDRRYAFAMTTAKNKSHKSLQGWEAGTHSSSPSGWFMDRSSSPRQRFKANSERLYAPPAMRVIDHDQLDEAKVLVSEKPWCPRPRRVYEEGENEVENGDKTRGQTTRLPCQETSSRQQNERDQRMWSALKTSIFSGGEVNVDTSCDGLDLSMAKTGIGVSTLQHNDYLKAEVAKEPRTCAHFKGARNMEQLDLERSLMDRTVRPHRVVTARALKTNDESPSLSKVKYARNLSASASRPRTRRESISSSSMWAGAGVGNPLQCTGVRAELVPRSGDMISGLDDDINASEVESTYNAAPAPTRARRTRHEQDDQQLSRKADLGRFQWVMNDEGLANFLQRPPSRQKEAFPTHLADVVPQLAFQAEVPEVNEQAKQHIEAARKNAVEQARPPSRHKPLERSLFLEIPESRQKNPPTFCPSRGAHVGGADSCSDVTPRSLELFKDGANKESTPTGDTPGTVFALDRRQDNPDRDGFSVLQVEGPCPFRIEVTNSYVQPRPPTIPVGREAALSLKWSPPGKKSGTSCYPKPNNGFLGPRPDANNPGKQLEPSNTTPRLAVSSFGKAVQVLGEDVGKGTCATPCRTFFSCSGQNSPAPNGFCSQESAAIEEFPKASPLSGGVVRGPEVKGRLTTSEGSRIGKLGGVVESTPWRSDRSKQAPHVAGRAETSDLWVNAGMPGISLAEWSLQSCDEADDGAVGVEHTFSTFANTLGVFLDSRG
ncbi:unnamed protein product [Ascophyllum nodosum]